MGFLKTAPMRYLLLVTGAWLVVFLLTRSVLLIRIWMKSAAICCRCLAWAYSMTWLF